MMKLDVCWTLKTSKNRWRLFNTDHELMTIEYDVYAYDLSVRGAYVDQTRLYINPACVCLALEGQSNLLVKSKFSCQMN